MKKSKYVFAHLVEPGRCGIYVPFGHYVSFISQNSWNAIERGDFEALSSETKEVLLRNKVIVEDGFDENCLNEFVGSKVMTRINAMYLVVAQPCNLACKYCVVENNVADSSLLGKKMTVETANSALDHFARVIDASFVSEARVTYYGGEPLLNPDVIKSTLPRIRNMEASGLKRPVEAVMITNGYAYNEEIAQLFKRFGSAICVSLDGKAEHHDAARVTHDGAPTHSRVLATIRRYQDDGIRLGLSCTIGQHNYKSLAEIARYFVKEVGIREIEFQMPYQVPPPGNQFYLSMKDGADEMLRAAEVMLDELDVDEFTTLRRLDSFAKGQWRHRDCGAAGGQIVVSPSGSVGPCHSLVGSGKCFAGNVNDPEFDLFSNRIIDEWSGRFPVNMPECHGCPFIALCGGGCPYNALTTHGTIWAKDPQVCPYLEKLMPWILQRLWSRKKIISGSEPARIDLRD